MGHRVHWGSRGFTRVRLGVVGFNRVRVGSLVLANRSAVSFGFAWFPLGASSGRGDHSGSLGLTRPCLGVVGFIRDC